MQRISRVTQHVLPPAVGGDQGGLSSADAAATEKQDDRAFGDTPALPPPLKFDNRRSPVLARKAMVACSQPTAAEAGLQILRAGGTAVDAAIAMAAALGVTEPMMTGVGGDCFMLFWEEKTKKMHALNGSGRAPMLLTSEKARLEAGLPWFRSTHAHTVTVPGTVAAWEAALSRWGKKSLSEVLTPAIALAEEGFPVSQISSLLWAEGAGVLKAAGSSELLVNGERAPGWGEVFRNPSLAAVLKEIAAKGARAGFYEGWPGQSIVDALQRRGSCMTPQDLKAHTVDFPEPISIPFMGVDVYMHPPNGSGIVTLAALQILKRLGPEHFPQNSAEYTHRLIEALRLAFIDGRRYNGDPEAMRSATAQNEQIPSIETLLSETHAEEQSKHFHSDRATVDAELGAALPASDTVSFQVVDEDGNSVSMVESLWMPFGSGIVPEGCGFALQNRGANFQLSPGPNQLMGGKRPYHTIIPAMCLRDNKLYCSFTNMGGVIQPQGLLQNLMNLVAFGMDPQRAVDRPRFCIADPLARFGESGIVFLQEGFDTATVQKLKDMGHNVKVISGNEMAFQFGKAQIIVRNPLTGVLWGGSDGRGDGLAMGY
eukprot:TRINITY_DN27133_c0_g1_i1.p1 TRINITY_DN27133_c0_g1~~TRINITY_DN27133_c0_g1_i1.p1  ORF type:complete len:598 (-),score=90.53 TRINITY_DN27133_c0_g1_i1:295-2088(-)